VDVRIGMLNNPKELALDLGDADRDKVKADIDAALAGSTPVLWLTDKDGRSVGVPTECIAYVEMGSADTKRPMGFAPER